MKNEGNGLLLIEKNIFLNSSILIMKNSFKSITEVYDLIAEKYTELFFEDFSDKEKIDKFLELLPENSKILDVGCGPGQFTKYFLELGYEVEGIDTSKEMIKIAKNKIKKDIFKIMDLRDLDYPDKSFDGIFASFSLIHIPKKELGLVLNEFHRVLKSDGIIYISVYEGEGGVIVDEPLKEGAKIFLKLFREGELKKILLVSGFNLIDFSKKSVEIKGSLGPDYLFVIGKKN
ncbi:MAG: methyltransferase domain-containing protein [Candidatus Aenigmarchaeota archaeon]|nr:methyltransferase domain-containing protein [Candidatus Aenigmarchaeota archaeon]